MEGDRIFVGLSTGCVRVYRLNDDSGRPDRSGGTTDPADDKLQLTDLLRENEKFSRRPVVQLAIVKEANILVSLSENIVSLHHTQDLTLVEKLDNSKGATLFAIISDVLKDVVTGIPTIVSKLAVAIKRRLVIWTWMDMELAPDTPELQLIATIKSLTWVNDTSIVVGTDVGFLAVDVASKAINDIIKPSSAGVGNVSAGVRFGSAASATVGYVTIGSWIPKPLSCRLSKEELLLVKDVNSLFIDKDGKALDKRQIPWATAPEAVGSSYPYMLSLNSPARGSLEVRNPDTLSHLQTISLPNAHILQLPQPSISLAHAGKNFLVGSDRRVWKMRGLAYDAQVQDLVLKHEYDEAISLLHLLEDTLIDDKSSRVREITVTKAKAMFSQAKYRKAFDLFAEASAAPAIVISLFPKLISGDMKRLDGTDLPPGEETNSPSRLAQASSRALTRQSEVVEKNDHTSPTRSLLGRIRGRQQNETDADVAVQSPNNETEDSEDDISTASGQLRMLIPDILILPLLIPYHRR